MILKKDHPIGYYSPPPPFPTILTVPCMPPWQPYHVHITFMLSRYAQIMSVMLMLCACSRYVYVNVLFVRYYVTLRSCYATFAWYSCYVHVKVMSCWGYDYVMSVWCPCYGYVMILLSSCLCKVNVMLCFHCCYYQVALSHGFFCVMLW